MVPFPFVEKSVQSAGQTQITKAHLLFISCLERLLYGSIWIEGWNVTDRTKQNRKRVMPMGFKTKFRELRESRGLSQAATDEVFGLMRGTCSNWENGFSEPEEELIEDIARFFSVRIRDLVEEA